MTFRMTVVLEYPSADSVPRVGADTLASDLGAAKVCALQFSDALRELEVLNDAAPEDVKERAFHAAFDYHGCSDPRRPNQPSGKQP